MRILVSETNWAAMAAAKDLRDAGFRLTLAADGGDLCAYAGCLAHDAAVVCDDLPDMDAASCIRTLRRAHPDLSIVALMTQRAAREDRVRMLSAGADDVVSARGDRRELAARIRTVARRRAGFAEPLITVGDLSIDCACRAVTARGRDVTLTAIEYEVLEYLAFRHGAVVSVDAMMEHLYGLDDEMPEPKIVTVYICHIRAKIAAAGGDAGMIETVWGRGYVLHEGPPLRAAA